MNSSVFALAAYGGDLIVGGFFTTAGGQDAARIARWDGSGWHPMGTGMNSTVRGFTHIDGDLVAGGSFTTADGQQANRVARWDGLTWQPSAPG